MATIRSRIRSVWNAFVAEETAKPTEFIDYGPSYGHRPERRRRFTSNERTIIASIFNRISVDAATHTFRHIRVDEGGNFIEEIDSNLNECLSVRANIDQYARHFRQDIFSSLIEQGVIAIVPVETTLDPNLTGGFDIKSLRVGTVLNWYPRHVRVRLYDDHDAQYKDITVAKEYVAIVENPFYSVMNEPNSTLQRLIHKLAMLDSIDEIASSGKLDLIIQLPYVIKSDARRDQAEKRRKDIEFQLSGSKYGIAYTDGTERITQLNRPVENNLLKQVVELTGVLYEQLGLTKSIMDGTADEQTMLNYYTRTIEPLLDSVKEAMTASFLTKTARTQKQTISYFRDPFKLVPVNNIAEIADKFTRNEIMSANEIRSVVGLKPSTDPKADELRNSNMPQPDEAELKDEQPISKTKKKGFNQNET